MAKGVREFSTQVSNLVTEAYEEGRAVGDKVGYDRGFKEAHTKAVQAVQGVKPDEVDAAPVTPAVGRKPAPNTGIAGGPSATERFKK